VLRRTCPAKFAAALLLVAAALYATPLDPPKPVSKVLYVLPNYLRYQSVSDAALAVEVAELRRRLGEGPYAKVGFTAYIFVSMENWNVDTNDRGAIRAALADTISQVDRAIARARANNIPICLSFLTAIRERYDPVQRDAERTDRRNMQWYMDNGMAGGWVTYSRYARRSRRVFEAYVREIGRIVADRMRQFPATFVAATGDGEIELSYDRSPIVNPAYTTTSAQLADYSPFAIAEFRDWLRRGGLYGAGQPLTGEAYEHAGRYAGDASPAVDTGGDGHTLNGDFGTTFTSWDLRYFNWSLDDGIEVDSHAIPSFVYEARGWQSTPDEGSGRFDPPRVRQPESAWWAVWDLFRQIMVWHYNRDFARWITTSAANSGALVLPSRWFSEQIPADYLFGGTPENPNYRLVTSASPHWTADISPYGGMGLTSFNIYAGGEQYIRTAQNLVPKVASRNVRWSLVEWHPSVPISEHLAIYDEDMRLMEQYQPTLLIPIYWGDPYYQIQNTGFEFALRDYIRRVKDGPPTR
jgi:hypothetical protein